MNIFILILWGLIALALLVSAIFNKPISHKSLGRVVKILSGLAFLLPIIFYHGHIRYSLLGLSFGLLIFLSAIDWKEDKKDYRIAHAVFGLILMGAFIVDMVFKNTMMARIVWMGMFGLLFLLCGIFNWGIVYNDNERVTKSKAVRIIIGITGAICVIETILVIVSLTTGK